jgi:hypothetical protein
MKKEEIYRGIGVAGDLGFKLNTQNKLLPILAS